MKITEKNTKAEILSAYKDLLDKSIKNQQKLNLLWEQVEEVLIQAHSDECDIADEYIREIEEIFGKEALIPVCFSVRGNVPRSLEFDYQNGRYLFSCPNGYEFEIV